MHLQFMTLYHSSPHAMRRFDRLVDRSDCGKRSRPRHFYFNISFHKVLGGAMMAQRVSSSLPDFSGHGDCETFSRNLERGHHSWNEEQNAGERGKYRYMIERERVHHDAGRLSMKKYFPPRCAAARC